MSYKPSINYFLTSPSSLSLTVSNSNEVARLPYKKDELRVFTAGIVLALY